MFAFRGVYHLLPLLLSVGMAVICSVSVLTLYRLTRKPSFTFQNLPLRSNARLTKAGRVLACLFAVYLLWTGHCFFVKYQQSRAEALRAEAGHLSGEERRKKVDASLGHLRPVELAPHLIAAKLSLANLLFERAAITEAKARLLEMLERKPGFVVFPYPIGSSESPALGAKREATRHSLP